MRKFRRPAKMIGGVPTTTPNLRNVQLRPDQVEFRGEIIFNPNFSPAIHMEEQKLMNLRKFIGTGGVSKETIEFWTNLLSEFYKTLPLPPIGFNC